jgi:sugar phosphate isomerase/epimerase
MIVTRRNFGRITLAGLPLPIAFGKPDSKVKGVQIGAQSYSFRDRPLDEAIKAMAELGLSECELWMGHVEPRGKGRGKKQQEALRKWRESVSMDEFKQIAAKFKKAGIRLFAYTYAFREQLSEKEIEHAFLAAKALGVKYITSSSNVSMAKRVAPFAEKYKIAVGMHGHSNIKDPNEFARPESFETAMSYSKYIGTNLDIGHFFAAGYDPVAFMQKHHKRIIGIHLKDRKKDQGENMPFGEGDTPIKECLQLIRKNRWKIPANIEYEYKGADTIAEVRRAVEFCRKCLA